MHYPTPFGFIKCPERSFAVRISAITSFMPNPADKGKTTLVWLGSDDKCCIWINAETLSKEIDHYYSGLPIKRS